MEVAYQETIMKAEGGIILIFKVNLSDHTEMLKVDATFVNKSRYLMNNN